MLRQQQCCRVVYRVRKTQKVDEQQFDSGCSQRPGALVMQGWRRVGGSCRKVNFKSRINKQ